MSKNINANLAPFTGGSTTGNSADAANRLWDNVYSNWGYTKVDPTASIDLSKNCHGYSTGLGTWTSIQPVLDDDYKESDQFSALVPGAIVANLGWINVLVHINGGDTPAFPSPGIESHSARITEVDPVRQYDNGDNYKRITVVEKNRVSALYTRKFNVDENRNKLGDILPIVLPWGTLPKFHIKK
jgi:hypothetical protein